jgi:hypothetical protein
MSVTQFTLRRDDLQRRLTLADPGPPPMAWTEKYRPRHLAGVVGQAAARFQLEGFLEAPHPAAFVFEGPTGVGKTTAALALANELGCNPDWSVHRISSGMMDQEGVEDAMRSLRFSAPGGGWRMVIADEAEAMSPKSRQLWLSILEDIPPRAIIVFTTNHPEKFEQRFLDRCERVRFGGDPRTLMQDADALVRSIWEAERAPGEPPAAATVPNLVEAGVLSFRRAVREIEQMARSRRRPGNPEKSGTTPLQQDGHMLEYTCDEQHPTLRGDEAMNAIMTKPATTGHGLTIRYTTAPEVYDGFGTRTLDPDAGTTDSGRTLRRVAIEDRHLEWQDGRYGSGLHCCVGVMEARKYPQLYRLRDMAPASGPVVEETPAAGPTPVAPAPNPIGVGSRVRWSQDRLGTPGTVVYLDELASREFCKVRWDAWMGNVSTLSTYPIEDLVLLIEEPTPAPAVAVEPGPAVEVYFVAGMRALTVEASLASAIIKGESSEVRTGWRTKHRGSLAIYARGVKKAQGAVIGTVDVLDCVPNEGEDGGFDWLLGNPRPCEPYPCKAGAGGFFPVPFPENPA